MSYYVRRSGRVHQNSRPRRKQSVQKPNGVISSRVQKVGGEHFAIVCVDPAKHRSEWMMADDFGNLLIEPRTLQHQNAFFKGAVAMIRQAQQQHQIQDMIVVLERTGNYHLPPKRAFAQAGFETRVVHPFATKQYRMPADPGNKTDETDLHAQHRAAIAGFGLCEWEWEPPYRDLQLRVRHRRNLVEKSASLACQIREHLHLAMPGYAGLFDRLLELPAPLAIAARCDSPAALIQLGQAGVSRHLHRIKVRHQQRTIDKVLAWAAQAADDPIQDGPMHQAIWTDLHELYQHFQRQIAALERQLAHDLVQTPYVRLMAIPGINVVSAAEFAGEMGSISGYANANAITGRAGLFPARSVGLIAHSMAGPPPGKGGGGKDNPSLSVFIDPASISEDGGVAMGVVSRENSDTSVPLIVTLGSDITGEVTFSGTVEFLKNEASKTFVISAVDDTEKDGDQTVTISVSATDHSGASASVTVVDDEELGVAYRLRYIPLPEEHNGFFIQDVNDSGQVAGWVTLLDLNGVSYEVGFYYDTITDTLLMSDDMIALDPAVWVDVQFVGLNNNGAIVGRVTGVDQVGAPILIYPDNNSATGWAYEILPLPADASTEQYGGGYARGVNDFGDIVGTYSRADNTQGAFAINTGLYDPLLSLPVTEFQLTNGATRPVVSNARKGVVEAEGVAYWFNFEDASVSQIPLPSAEYHIGAQWQPSISNDEQIAATKEMLASKKKGGTYSYTPAVVWDGFNIWEGSNAEALIVNSADGLNFVGDIIGRNRPDGAFGAWWLQHANLGYLEIESLLVFDEPVGTELSDLERWYLNSYDLIDMSDRIGATSLGMIIGNLTGDSSRLPFVLIPEVQP